MSSAGKVDANAEDSGTTLVNAKNAVVETALAVRQPRLEWERAQALLDEAKAGLEAAQIEREMAVEQERAVTEAARSVALAEQRWRQALTALDVQGLRLRQAKNHLQAAETTLQQAEAA